MPVVTVPAVPARWPTKGKRTPSKKSMKERPFLDFLRRHGWNDGWETTAIRLSDGRIITPDIDFRDDSNLFLDLTQADLYDHPSKLPKRIRRKNAVTSDSGQEYISPAEYLRRKIEKHRAAEHGHPGLNILTVLQRQQDEMMAMDSTFILELMIELKQIDSEQYLRYLHRLLEYNRQQLEREIVGGAWTTSRRVYVAA